MARLGFFPTTVRRGRDSNPGVELHQTEGFEGRSSRAALLTKPPRRGLFSILNYCPNHLSEGGHQEAGEGRAAAAEEAGQARWRQLGRRLGGLLQGQRVRGRGDCLAGHQPARRERVRGRHHHQRHPDRKLRHFVR